MHDCDGEDHRGALQPRLLLCRNKWDGYPRPAGRYAVALEWAATCINIPPMSPVLGLTSGCVAHPRSSRLSTTLQPWRTTRFHPQWEESRTGLPPLLIRSIYASRKANHRFQGRVTKASHCGPITTDLCVYGAGAARRRWVLEPQQAHGNQRLERIGKHPQVATLPTSKRP